MMAMTLTGCYEDFNPGINTEPVLCINSIITSGQPIEVSVSRTWLYNDQESEENHQVTDAKVTIYVNGSAVGQEYTPQEGDRIRIVAESATYGNAEAEVTVPVAVPITSVKIMPEITEIWSDSRPEYQMLTQLSFNLTAEMEITDPGDRPDYYKFTFSQFANEDAHLYTGELQYQLEPIFSEHINALESVSGIVTDDFPFFTDNQFSGGTYTLHLFFKDMGYFVNSPTFNEDLLDCGLQLTLSSVSPSYYNYANYLWQRYDGLTGELGEIGFSEPIWGYSNVSTGAGVVAAVSNVTYTVSLKNFLGEIIKRPSNRPES